MIHGIAVKDVFVIGNWIWGLPRGVIVVLAAVFIHKLILFSTGFSERKCRTSAHGCRRKEGTLWDTGVERTALMWHRARGEWKAEAEEKAKGGRSKL